MFEGRCPTADIDVDEKEAVTMEGMGNLPFGVQGENWYRAEYWSTGPFKYLNRQPF